MTTLSVHTRSRAYDIFVGDGLLRQAGPLCREVNPRGARALIVTDSNVYPLYAGQVARSLESAGYAVSVFAFPAGEEQTACRLSEFGAEAEQAPFLDARLTEHARLILPRQALATLHRYFPD